MLTLPPPWDTVAAAFLRSMQERSGSVKSREKYENVLALFFRDPAKPPDAYSRADVQAFLDHGSFGRWNIGAPISVSTRNSRLSALNSFYAFATSYEIDGASIMPGLAPVRGFRYLRPSIRYRAMSIDELERFFSVIPDTLAGARDKAFFTVVFWTAKRVSEILHLCWRDIEATPIMENGVARDGFVYRYTAKGQSRSILTAELPAPAYMAIDAFLIRSGRKASITPDEPIFSSVYLGRGRKHRNRVPLTHVQIGAQFQRYINAAGLRDARKLTIHSLRHTACLLRFQSGENIVSLKNLLGHTSLQTTTIYLQTLTGVADSGAALLSRKFARLTVL